MKNITRTNQTKKWMNENPNEWMGWTYIKNKWDQIESLDTCQYFLLYTLYSYLFVISSTTTMNELSRTTTAEKKGERSERVKLSDPNNDQSVWFVQLVKSCFVFYIFVESIFFWFGYFFIGLFVHAFDYFKWLKPTN